MTIVFQLLSIKMPRHDDLALRSHAYLYKITEIHVSELVQQFADGERSSQAYTGLGGELSSQKLRLRYCFFNWTHFIPLIKLNDMALFCFTFQTLLAVGTCFPEGANCLFIIAQKLSHSTKSTPLSQCTSTYPS